MSGVNFSGRATPRLELGAAVMEYMLDNPEFAGLQVLPIFQTRKKEANFPAITRESLMRTAETKRAPRSSYNRDGFEAEDKSFKCVEHGLEGVLDDSERELYKSDFDAEMVTTKSVAHRLLMNQEARIAAKVFNTSTFTGAALYTTHAANPWDNIASDIITQVRNAREKVRQNCGMKANAVIMSETNINRAIATTVVKGAIQYVARLTEAELRNALADLFGVEQVIVAGGVKNTSKEGKAFSGSDIWSDDYVMVARVVSNPADLTSPGLGRTFLWTDDSPQNDTVESYRDDPIRSDVFRVRHHVDENLIDPYFGHLLKVDA